MTTYLRGLRVMAGIALCGGISWANASAQFETRAGLPVLPGPQSVAVGDFNGDGKLDLAVASLVGTTQVSVLLGNGDGTFQQPVNYDVPNGPDYVTVADLRHIGILDLVVTNFANSVSILLGKGDGTFQPAVNYDTPEAPGFVAVGDFNGDHVVDLLVREESGFCHCISVLLGNGDGTFQEPPITTTPLFPPLAIGIGDFDHDGKLDVATAGCFSTSCEINILPGNGDGTFGQGATYSVVNGGGSNVVVADFRRNGNLDLAFRGTASSIGVLLGNGDGTFGQPVYYPGESAMVTAADINGDSKSDLVVVSGDTTFPVAGVFVGNGDGTFKPEVTYPVGKEPSFVAVGDFNGDRRPDLAVADDLGDAMITLLNTGLVSFSPTTPLSFPTQLVGTTSAPLSVTLTNTGFTTLSISSIKVSGPYQLGSGTTCGNSVAPGGNCILSAVFEPTAAGTKTGFIGIADSASTKPQIIELSGTGTVISLSPAQLNFGSQKVGTKSAPQTITVTNTSSAAVTFSGVAKTGIAAHDYSETNTCGSQIGPGATCTISVTFTPSATGTRSAILGVKDSGGGSPQTVALTGTGT